MVMSKVFFFFYHFLLGILLNKSTTDPHITWDLQDHGGSGALGQMPALPSW